MKIKRALVIGYAVLFLVGALGAVAWAKPWHKHKLAGNGGTMVVRGKHAGGFSFSYGMGDAGLGADVQSMSEDLRAYFGAPKDQGVLVSEITPGSAAEKAGLHAGDVIMEIEGDAIDDPSDLFGSLADKKAGDEVKLVVIRDKKRTSLTAKLTDDPMGSGGMQVNVPNMQLHGFGKFFGGGGVTAMPGGGYVVNLGGDDELREKLDKAEQRVDDLEKRIRELEKKVK